MSITELYAVHITETVQEKYENAVPKFTQRPSIREKKFDDHKFYYFVLFDMETNSTGNLVELCQLAAVDTLTNNFHVVIPTNRDIGPYLQVKSKQTRGKNFKWKMYSIQRGSTLPLQNALIESATTAALNTSKPIFTVLAGHNAFSFDIPILLQNGGDSFITKLSPLNVRQTL